MEIARSPGDVWAFVVDHLNDPLWCGKVKSVEPRGQRSWRVMHKPVPLRPAVELSLEQLAADPPSRLTMRQEDSASVFHVEYLLQPIPTGTRFTQVSEFEWKRLPRVLRKTFERGVRRDVRRQLRDLQGALDGGAGQAGGG